MRKQAEPVIDLTEYEVTQPPPHGFEGPETAELMAFWREMLERCPDCLSA
jgi:hypothetical protein